MDEDYRNFVGRMGSFENVLNNESELAHHGIFGMQWGVRRTDKQLDTLKSKLIDTRSSDKKEADDIRIKSVNQMSNSELKKLNERRQLEDNYMRLNPSKVKNGYAYVTGAVAVMGTSIALYNNYKSLVNIGKGVSSKLGPLLNNSIDILYAKKH